MSGAVGAVRLRSAEPSDAALVAELGARVFTETFASSNDALNLREYVRTAFAVERVRDELADPRSITLIAETGDGPAGYAHLHAAEPPAGITGDAPIELVRLYVDARFHGSGVGARLMETALDAARAAGYRTMHLGVWEHNPRAQAFYRKWGFERAGEQHFQLGAESQTDWLLQRAI